MVLSLLFSLLVLAITLGGLALIVAPQLGRRLLGHMAKAIGLVIGGIMMFQAACAALHC